MTNIYVGHLGVMYMARHFLSALIFFTISNLSLAIPPALEEITEGVEKSLIAHHVKNLSVYSEQLARLLLDAETVLIDQAAEDKAHIPIYYGAPHEPMAAAKQFIDKPVNMLKLREFPEEPFDHIKIHKYGFGGFCDKPGEEKAVKAIAALAVAYKKNKDPAILSVFEDKSKEPLLDKDAVMHIKLVKGIFSKLSGEEFKEDKDALIDKSVDALIADNNGFQYMDHLKNLMDNSFSGDPSQIPFKDSPYNRKYLYNYKNPADQAKMNVSVLYFPWINQVVLMRAKDRVYAKPLSPVPPAAPHIRSRRLKGAGGHDIFKSPKKVSFSPEVEPVEGKNKIKMSPKLPGVMPIEEPRAAQDPKSHGSDIPSGPFGERGSGDSFHEGRDMIGENIGEGKEPPVDDYEEEGETDPDLEGIEGSSPTPPSPHGAPSPAPSSAPPTPDAGALNLEGLYAGFVDGVSTPSSVAPSTPADMSDYEMVSPFLEQAGNDDFMLPPAAIPKKED